MVCVIEINSKSRTIYINNQEFAPTKHPRKLSKPGKGEFVKKGSGGIITGDKPLDKSHTNAKVLITPQPIRLPPKEYGRVFRTFNNSVYDETLKNTYRWYSVGGYKYWIYIRDFNEYDVFIRIPDDD